MVSVSPCWLLNVTPSKGSSCKSNSHKPLNGCLTFSTENIHLCLLPSASNKRLCSPQTPKIPPHEPQQPWRPWDVVLQCLTSQLTLAHLWVKHGNQQSECTFRWICIPKHVSNTTVVQTETHTCMEKAANSYVNKTTSPQTPEDAKKHVWDTASCFIQICEPAPVFTDASEFPPWLPVLIHGSPLSIPLPPWRNIRVSTSPPKTKRTPKIISPQVCRILGARTPSCGTLRSVCNLRSIPSVDWLSQPPKRSTGCTRSTSWLVSWEVALVCRSAC